MTILLYQDVIQLMKTIVCNIVGICLMSMMISYNFMGLVALIVLLIVHCSCFIARLPKLSESYLANDYVKSLFSFNQSSEGGE
jgi:hypothetical protein